MKIISDVARNFEIYKLTAHWRFFDNALYKSTFDLIWFDLSGGQGVEDAVEYDIFEFQ